MSQLRSHSRQRFERCNKSAKNRQLDGVSLWTGECRHYQSEAGSKYHASRAVQLWVALGKSYVTESQFAILVRL
jgi:hypothetical protein